VSWTDVFPLFDDQAVDEFDQDATVAEKYDIASLFSISKWFNRRPAKHIVASSLFWKPAQLLETEFPKLTRELLENPEQFGIRSRISQPWSHYVAPLIEGAGTLHQLRPDVTFRVYLANDLEFLVPELVAAGCEVALMDSSSLRHNPGAMWRFLAMEEDSLVTITDSDRARDVIYDVERTEIVDHGGLACWRVAYTWGNEETRKRLPTHYRPILACQFGSAVSLPMAKLMQAFLWHTLRESINTHVTLANGKTAKIFGVEWPAYGFDEWFLLAAIYPRMAANGVLTFASWSDGSLNQWFALDIEYCTWANRKAEILFCEPRKASEAIRARESPERQKKILTKPQPRK
jgi:hypothetical protein